MSVLFLKTSQRKIIASPKNPQHPLQNRFASYLPSFFPCVLEVLVPTCITTVHAQNLIIISSLGFTGEKYKFSVCVYVHSAEELCNVPLVHGCFLIHKAAQLLRGSTVGRDVPQLPSGRQPRSQATVPSCSQPVALGTAELRAAPARVDPAQDGLVSRGRGAGHGSARAGCGAHPGLRASQWNSHLCQGPKTSVLERTC